MNGSFFDNVGDQEGFCMAVDICFPLTEMEDSSFTTPHLETMLHDGFVMDFQDHLDDMDITAENIYEYLEDPILNGDINTDVSVVSLEEISNGCVPSYHQQLPVQGEADQLSLNQSMISSDTSLDVTSSKPPSLVLPTEGLAIDNELGVFHLLMAYAEAMEMGQVELAEVIVKRISEKVSPVGDTLERLMYYMFQTLDKQSDYLKQESLKNFYQAFKAFYQIFPNGKFAHLVANLAILEALPNDASIIHIFDFDIGEGIQWASLIGAIAHQRREVILTSVKFSRDGESDCSPLIWKFEDTRKRLSDYARPYGLKLKVEEIEIGDLATATNNMQEVQGVWFVFNCMIGLPHMARVRSRKDVLEFLESAQNFLQRCHGSDRGIITLGDGDAWEKVRHASNYGAFLDGNMAHYQALLESIKLNFPVHLGDARTAMECLFVAPLVSSLKWAKRWEEKKKYGNLDPRLSLEGWKLSQDSLMEAREVVRESKSLYGVRIEGETNNEIVMDWRGMPMVKVSCWRR